jgi:hypothetical protein
MEWIEQIEWNDHLWNVTIEWFELNDIVLCVQSIQTISCDWCRLKPYNN